MKTLQILTILITIFLISCEAPDPNATQTGENELESLELERDLVKADKKFEDIIYVPIYSDIYVDKVNQNSLLVATLSIRNTSLTDSLFVSKIDYYNTQGDLVRSYLDRPIALSGMATVNYVIEKDDTAGGSGANFIINLSSDHDLKPLIQAIMIGENGNKGFSFSTDGYSIK